MSCQPYPGLRPFAHDEDRLFFGREQQIDELLDRLRDPRFIAVLGSSGSGKSSLVRAGLLPALRGGQLAGSGADWQIAELRPGTHPLQALAEALARQTNWGRELGSQAGDAATPDTTTVDAANDTAEALERDLRKGPLALNWRLGLQPLADGARLLLVIDQFEELFRYRPPVAEDATDAPATGQPDDAAAFVALLLAAVSHPSVYVVITMRSDFLGDCARHPGLPEAVNAGLYLTPRLDPEQMAEAIRLPPRVCGGDIEPALVERLLDAAHGQMDQLPLLQHALMRLWQRARDDSQAAEDATKPPLPAGEGRGEEQARRIELNLSGFEQLGGLPAALDAHAEEAWAELSPDQQTIAETLFRGLTERGPDQRDTRRPARLGDIAALVDVEDADIIAIAEVFRRPDRSFLTPPPPPAADGQALDADTTLDLSHEALARQWQRLRAWTRDEGDRADLYRRLEADAQRQDASPWSGAELALVRPWLDTPRRTRRWALRYAAGATPKQRAAAVNRALGFLGDSADAADQAEAEREARQRAKLRRARRITLYAVVTLLLMSVLAAWGWYERVHADRARDRAEAIELKSVRDLFDSELSHSALLARTEDYAGAKARLAATQAMNDRIPTTRRLARDLLAGYVGLMGGSAERVYRGAEAPLFAVAVSPDGRWVAASGERGTLVIWDADSGALVQRLEGHSTDVGQVGAVWDLAFHPGGDWLASAGDDEQVMLWSLPTSDRPAALLRKWQAPDRVTSLAVSPDGRLLASGSDDGVITLWDPRTGEALRTLEAHRAQIGGLTFSPDGTRLASAGYDGIARVWDVASGDRLTRLTKHRALLLGVAFSPDGRWIATSGDDRRVMLRNVGDGALRVFTGHRSAVFGVAFAERPGDPDAAPWLIAAGFDRSLRVWDGDSAVTQALLQGHTAGVVGIAVHGDTLYSASNDGRVRRWSLARPRQRLLDLPSEPASAAIAPDGSAVAVGFADGGLRTYGLPGLALIDEVAAAHEHTITRLAWSADGKLLASAGADDLARLWRIAPDGGIGPLLDLTGHEDAVHDLAFSPDGGTLATAGYDGRIGLFDTASGEARFIQSTGGKTLSVAFDPSGTRVYAADRDDGRVRIWDLSTPDPTLLREPRASDDQLAWAEPSPDGGRIAALGRDPIVTLLDADSGATLARLPGHQNTVIKARFLPGGRQLATISADATVRVWDLDQDSELFALRLPTNRAPPVPLLDFDLRCTPARPGPGGQNGQNGDATAADGATDGAATGTIAATGHCWLVVPLVRGKLAVYDLGQAPWPTAGTATGP